MALKDGLLAELKHEAGSTKKILETVPVDKYSWKPHEKSMTAGRLASHIAEIPVWVNRILEDKEFVLTICRRCAILMKTQQL